MVIVCQQCAARLQLDDSKIPARAFTVRCPKCQHMLNAQPPAPAPAAPGAAGLGEPAAQGSRFSRPTPAPAFRLEGAGGDADAPDPLRGDRDEIATLLSSLLQRALTSAATQASRGVSTRGLGDDRCVLVCASPEARFAVARVLVENGFEAYVAEDTTQAIERMRENKNKIDVVILDPTFDAQEQGAAFIKRELAALRPAARRRVFFVLLSPDLRTGDPHHAFVNHANMTVNPADLEELPQMLNRGIRDFNELYRDFNKALQLSDF